MFKRKRKTPISKKDIEDLKALHAASREAILANTKTAEHLEKLAEITLKTLQQR